MLTLFYIVFIIYEEVLYKLVAANNFYLSIVGSLFYYVAIALFLALITSLLPNKISKHFFRIIIFIISFWYAATTLVKKTFDITISIVATKMADQFAGGGFISLTLNVIKNNILIILLIFIPFILSIVITIFYKNKFNLKKILIQLLLIIVCFGLFIGSLFIDTNNYGLKELYFKKQNNTQNVEYFGVLPSLLIDVRKKLTGFEEEIIIEEVIEEVIEEPETVYLPHSSNIDFKSLNETETNETIKKLNTYINSETPTYTNDYTGLFEGKNLIYIMAESFDGYGVTKELTPTLYKMIHEGFYFSNYYSPTNLSTIGGEFQELTGLIPDLTCLSWKWREQQGAQNYYPYALGNLFKNQGYSTYAYHNHDYNFQDRNLYLKTQGFDNYIGCGNGIENKGVSCSLNGFPESDDEMILGTYEDYINDEHFMVYYATVSGHMGWDFGENKMSIKHQSEVETLEYSETIKAYLSAELELELAMKDLLKVLEENGRLNDTVIVLAADHHPYGLSYEQMEELASVNNKTIDETFELYKNNLIIYNPEVEHTTISKPCNTIDILPTTLNLFNIDYDSRLIIGKDILSTSQGLVIFADDSWISDYGKYNANTKAYTKIQDTSIDENTYINKTINTVYNRKWASTNIMYYDYYRKIFNK